MRVRAEAATTTKNARRGLKPQSKPYLRTIGQGIAVGYRRKAKDGVWIASLYLGGGKYREAVIGTADDIVDADGATILDFEQARKAVLSQVEAWRAESKAKAGGAVQTVRTAIEAYVSVQNAREDAQDRPRRMAERVLKMHVLSDPIADVALHTLTETTLSGWMGRIPSRLKATTKKRIVNSLKAALNAAAKRHRATLPAEIGVIIKFGLALEIHEEPVARDNAALPDADIRRILAAAAEVDAEGGWDGDFHRMIAVLAATGTRVSQAIRLKVGDLQATKSRLMVPVSRKGRGGKASSQTPVPIGDDVLALLLPAVRGRKPSEPLLTRWLHELQTGGKWVRRDERHAWKTSAEMARAWAATLARAKMPKGTVMYSLRHSSIVRQLKAALPVRLVAALHDTSVAMIERHYSSSIASMLDDVAAGAIIPLIDRDERKVIALRG